MAFGTTSKRGIYRYGEDDADTTFSELLNRGMDSVHDAQRCYSGTPAQRAALTLSDVAIGSIWQDTDTTAYMWRMTATGWLRISGEKVLWSGAAFPIAASVLSLSESALLQPRGLILRWSAFEGGAQKDWWWQETHISRRHLESRMQNWTNHVLGSPNGTVSKEIRVSTATALVGADVNSAAGRELFVLREIVGY